MSNKCVNVEILVDLTLICPHKKLKIKEKMGNDIILSTIKIK